MHCSVMFTNISPITRMSLSSKFDAFVRLNPQKNDILRHILHNCGIIQPARPTKQAMIDQIKSSILQPTIPGSPLLNESNTTKTLVSIDVGLKNFSLSRFIVPVSSGLPETPVLTQWFKLNLPYYCHCEGTIDPIAYSEMIHKVFLELILGTSRQYPDILVIERQRFRTAGGSNIQESVLKSNLVEFMLYSAIRVYRDFNPDFQPQLISASPRLMAAYWEALYADKVKGAKTNPKKIRMTIVDGWFRSFFAGKGNGKVPFKLSDVLTKYIDSSHPVIDKRLHRFSSDSRRIYESMRLLNDANTSRYNLDLEDGGVKKGDDVTDSLLHGITQIRFETNREMFRRKVAAYI